MRSKPQIINTMDIEEFFSNQRGRAWLETPSSMCTEVNMGQNCSWMEDCLGTPGAAA